MKTYKAEIRTYSTDDGSKIKLKKGEARICWGEPNRDLEILIDKQEDQETCVYLPLKSIISMIMSHIEEKK